MNGPFWRAVVRFFLMVLSVAWGLLALPSFLVVPMGVMLFDAPGSEQQATPWIAFGLVVSFPVLCLLSSLGTGLFVWKGQLKLAAAVSTAPLVPIALFFVLYGIQEVFV